MLNIKNVKTTQKKKKNKSNNKLWEVFDNECNLKKQPLELMYSKQNIQSREICELCNFPLHYS